MPHASNAPNAACGSCFNLNTVCFDKPSALEMVKRLGASALLSAATTLVNVARS
jgi:hypothetical protein